jgi:hypothetical protein
LNGVGKPARSFFAVHQNYTWLKIAAAQSRNSFSKTNNILLLRIAILFKSWSLLLFEKSDFAAGKTQTTKNGVLLSSAQM